MKNVEQKLDIHQLLEKELDKAYEMGLFEGRQEALCALIEMVPGAILRTNDKVDIDTSGFDKEAFAKDAEGARIFELKLAYQLLFDKYELKTVPYESWSEYLNILIEVGKDRHDDEMGSLFQIETDGWIHQLLDEDGLPFKQEILNVKYLKKRYELLKHDKNNFILCPNERSQKTWCMPINMYVNDHVLINLLNEKNDIIKAKDREIEMNLEMINKLKQEINQLKK
jgi:hypothetical protein